MRRSRSRGRGSHASARSHASSRSDEAAQAVERLATLLEAGVSPSSAWGYLAESSAHPVLVSIAGAVTAGERPVEAFGRNAALLSGHGEAWCCVAAAWTVADASGAPLAPSLRELGAALRDRAETERDVDVSLAGPLATSRLVGWLPVAGLGLGTLMGIDVLGALFGSAVGAGAAVAGVSLMIGGHLWSRRMSARAVPPSGAPGLQLDLVAVALGGGASAERATALVTGSLVRFGVRAEKGDDLVEILALAERAGAPAAELLRSAARQSRREARSSAQSAAAALGVRLMLPLGVCILPAFMLLGVAPVVLAIVSSTLGAG